MIRYKVGDILKADTEALVNTVNTVGVMGKGIALAFKKAYPDNFKQYKKAVDEGKVRIGAPFVTQTGLLQPKYIINFPTKKHWRHPSKLSYIEKGMESLVNIIKDNDIKSLAIPPLGCGNGKLNWDEVKPIMEHYLSPLAKDHEFIIFEPGYNDQEIKEKEEVKLTSGRAMLLHALDEYGVLGYEINLLVVQKAAYFLQRLGEPLRLKHEKGYYGPYAHNLNHLLKHINGFYIKYKSQRNKPDTTVHLVEDKLERVKSFVKEKLDPSQKERVQKLLDLIEGFESPYGLELLATVDYIKQNKPDISFDELKNEVHNWTNRKRSIMKDHHLKVAYQRLEQSDLYT
ncbi:type II toxin-antitoxin system antitoxin DNA ADP-ribosyl glycohydrolase DarG [Fodinibius sp. SL11]|uniref:type II toxin-antitoxin system antitoxin DNA ADP-ribosyl glycohydrolase DarG n=1 Tax=Fodinibius sp. SL11 TaxID=3425690 RepID=UPI003F880551